MNSIRRYFLIIILIAIFLLLQYELWFSRGGLIQHHRLQQELKAQKALLQKQQAENKSLLAEVMKVKKDPHQIEAHARDDLGMVKQGEEYIEIAIKQGDQHENITQQR